MTQLTGICGQRMSYALTQANAGAVVTAGLGAGLTNHCAVIKYGVEETQGAVMTYVAFCRSGYVSRPLTQGDGTVVAVAAHIGALVVCERQDQR